jgi:hypothetical protein
MIEDGRAYALRLVVQAILQKLEQSGLLAHDERFSMLDDVCQKIRESAKSGAMSPNASREASLTAGLMYLKPDPPKEPLDP